MLNIHRTSEVQALFRLRQSLVYVGISYGYFLLGFALWRRGAELPVTTLLVVLGGFLFAVAVLILARGESRLWLITASLLIVVVYIVIDPLITISWIQLSVLVACLVISRVFLFWDTKISYTVCAIVLLAAFNLIAYYSEATSLLRTGSFLGRGTVSSFMILSTGFYTLYGWKRMIERAKFNDARMNHLISEMEILRKSQASQKLWRELVVRVHETTLNTIRSILTLRDRPIESLRSAIEASTKKDDQLISRAQERRSGSLLGAIRSGIDGAAPQEKVRIISQGVNLHLDSSVSGVIEQVVREAIRNSIEHANSKNIEILWRTTIIPNSDKNAQERGRIFISISDDGIFMNGRKGAGIGTNLVMAKNIELLGGTFEILSRDGQDHIGTVVTIEIPNIQESIDTDVIDFPSYSAVDLGKYMALLTLFGPAMTGILFFPILGIWWPGQIVPQILGFLSLVALLYRTFVQSRRLGWIESIICSIGLLGVIIFLHLNPLNCIEAQPFQWVLNSVIYGLFIIALWGKWQVSAVAYPTFLFIVAPLHDLLPQNCNYIFNFPVLNTLFSFIFVSVVFTLVYKSFERVEKNSQKRELQNAQIVNEVQRSDYAFEKILELDSYAKERINDIAAAVGPISMTIQDELRRIDAQLRAEIQIDPILSSGFTLLARDFIIEVTNSERWLEVKSIHGDEDTRPIPSEIIERLLAIAPDLMSDSVIQVLITDEHAELQIRMSSQIPDSVLNLKRIVDSIPGSGIICFINQLSPQEVALCLRRERLSQKK